MTNTEPSASEAVFMFAGWLTTRKKTLCVGSVHDASEVHELVDRYIKEQGWKCPQRGWGEKVRPMPEEDSGSS